MTIGSCNIINIQNKKCNVVPKTNNWKHTVINERINLPNKMPDIRNIQSVTASLNIKSTNFILTPDSRDIKNTEGTLVTGVKLLVNGEIDQNITYESGECCKLYSFNYKHPFTTFIVLDPGYDITKPICMKSCIEGVMVQQIGCRQIVKNVAVFVTVS